MLWRYYLSEVRRKSFSSQHLSWWMHCRETPNFVWAFNFCHTYQSGWNIAVGRLDMISTFLYKRMHLKESVAHFSSDANNGRQIIFVKNFYTFLISCLHEKILVVCCDDLRPAIVCKSLRKSLLSIWQMLCAWNSCSLLASVIVISVK